jgi:hypothetical protein
LTFMVVSGAILLGRALDAAGRGGYPEAYGKKPVRSYIPP